ncbi:beta-ketoacyl synthase N-terminal-like domain-containing protein [Streptomyces eurocidicus]|uniref:beta-ketoacyl synthase N-terminal-like domain-containing protein n=1 Tax=Streptomyces eurocidicus TaxID=66423 RepID=UPI000C9A3741|nr:beta-ketoacyl synthase N-terminal-like domain-containing protein [Streptomyces eurocidicus]
MTLTTAPYRTDGATDPWAPGRSGAPFPVAPVDLLGCAVHSAAGPGTAALATALADGRGPAATDAADRPTAPDDVPYPPLDVRPAAGFDPAAVLGRKGLARLTRTDLLGLATCTEALEAVGGLAGLNGPAGADGSDVAGETGVVLGSSLGSASAVAEFTRDTLVQERPYLVNPSAFPSTLMNSAASRAAIRHGLTGLNATVSGGPLASLHALRYARNALVRGHARQLLVGGVEELSPHGAWAWHRAGALAPDTALGEGCAVFVARAAPAPGERPGPRRSPGCSPATSGPPSPVRAPRRGPPARRPRARRPRPQRGRPGDVAVAAVGAAGRRGWAAVEERGLRLAFGPGPEPLRLRVQPLLGETHSASGALQLAAVLARWQDVPTARPATAERAAVITSVGPDGSVGCAVVVRPESA